MSENKNSISVKVSEQTTHVVAEFCQRLLGPAVEVSDFLSDKIRFYRWKSAAKTLSRAQEIAETNNIASKEVPIKFLVPFLERCSLEDDESELTERWASLLANASGDFKQEYSIYSRILSEVSSAEVKVLEELAGLYKSSVESDQHQYSTVKNKSLIDVSSYQEIFEGKIRHFLAVWTGSFTPPESNSESIAESNKRNFEVWDSVIQQSQAGVKLTRVRYPVMYPEHLQSSMEGEATSSYLASTGFYKEDLPVIHSLVRLGLAELVVCENTINSNMRRFGVEYMQLTPFGIRFYEACQVR